MSIEIVRWSIRGNLENVRPRKIKKEVLTAVSYLQPYMNLDTWSDNIRRQLMDIYEEKECSMKQFRFEDNWNVTWAKRNTVYSPLAGGDDSRNKSFGCFIVVEKEFPDQERVGLVLDFSGTYYEWGLTTYIQTLFDSDDSKSIDVPAEETREVDSKTMSAEIVRWSMRGNLENVRPRKIKKEVLTAVSYLQPYMNLDTWSDNIKCQLLADIYEEKGCSMKQFRFEVLNWNTVWAKKNTVYSPLDGRDNTRYKSFGCFIVVEKEFPDQGRVGLVLDFSGTYYECRNIQALFDSSDSDVPAEKTREMDSTAAVTTAMEN